MRRLLELLNSENDKVLWRQLVVVLVDKGLLALVLVLAGLLGNMLLEKYRFEQTQQQSRQRLLLEKRLDAVREISAAYGELVSGFMLMTDKMAKPVPDPRDRLLDLIKGVADKSNQFEPVLTPDFMTNTQKQIDIFKGIYNKNPAQWREYRGFVARLASLFEMSWRRMLPRFDDDQGQGSAAADFELDPLPGIDLYEDKDGSVKYLDTNFQRWKGPRTGGQSSTTKTAGAGKP